MIATKLAPGTPVLAVWGRERDPAEEWEVLAHKTNGVWVMWDGRDILGHFKVKKQRLPLHALKVRQD